MRKAINEELTVFVNEEFINPDSMCLNLDLHLEFNQIKPVKAFATINSERVTGVATDLQSLYNLCAYDMECFANYGDNCLDIINAETGEIILSC